MGGLGCPLATLLWSARGARRFSRLAAAIPLQAYLSPVLATLHALAGPLLLCQVVDDLHPVRVLQLFSAIPQEVSSAAPTPTLGRHHASRTRPFLCPHAP